MISDDAYRRLEAVGKQLLHDGDITPAGLKALYSVIIAESEKDLQQEDIDWVYGACARSWHNPLWCLAHSSRFRERVQRCDDWQDFQLSVETVIDRLKEER